MSLELKKLKAELLRVQAAKAEIDYIMEQKMEEVRRLQSTIEKQIEAEKILIEKLSNIGGITNG